MDTWWAEIEQGMDRLRRWVVVWAQIKAGIFGDERMVWWLWIALVADKNHCGKNCWAGQEVAAPEIACAGGAREERCCFVVLESEVVSKRLVAQWGAVPVWDAVARWGCS